MARRDAALAAVPTAASPPPPHNGQPEHPAATLADQFDLRPRHIRTAIDFAAPHREVIEEQIAANVRAAKQARELGCPPRRAESVIQACGSPAPGLLMPLPTATPSTPSTATTQFAA
jgi:hypothetical protein